MEEQALCRIHRLGQHKEVKTIRYRIKGSFEEVRNKLLLDSHYLAVVDTDFFCRKWLKRKSSRDRLLQKLSAANLDVTLRTMSKDYR
jgi:hypothetical protein